MRKILVLLFLFAGTLSYSQTADSTIVQPTGAYVDTAYYNVAFCIPDQLVKVQPARLIIRYVTFPTYNQAIEQYWEVVAKGRFDADNRNKAKWARVPYTNQDIIWVKRIK
jgi:hypothetical protein